MSTITLSNLFQAAAGRNLEKGRKTPEFEPVQNQISGLVSVAEVDGYKSASWPWEKTVMRDVREEQCHDLGFFVELF